MSFIGRTHGEGITTIDYLEDKTKLNINVRDNLYAPMVLAEAAKKYDIHLSLHPSYYCHCLQWLNVEIS